MSDDFWIQLVPLALVWIILAVFCVPISRRKGVSAGWIVIGTFPVWGGLYLLWLASLTDKVVLERLAKLEGRG